MRVCLAGTNSHSQYLDTLKTSKFLLESFYYFKDWQTQLFDTTDLFLLDSGAFTFMSDSSNVVDWEKYITRYANFIKANDIEYFFELDIDSVVGYEKVKGYRVMLENLAGRKCIPVWHYPRGKEEYEKLCQEYDYVAIGGLAIKEVPYNRFCEALPWFVRYAHKQGCKVHGLGFTSVERLKNIHFDSVDSTSWTAGARFGMEYRFINGTFETHTAGKGMRYENIKEVEFNNLIEWIKFQKYAEVYL